MARSSARPRVPPACLSAASTSSVPGAIALGARPSWRAIGVAGKLGDMRLAAAAKGVREGVAETLTYTRFPMRHWRRIRTNNAIGWANREIGRHSRVVGAFSDGRSALMLLPARLKYVADSEWGSRRYLDVSLLHE